MHSVPLQPQERNTRYCSTCMPPPPMRCSLVVDELRAFPFIASVLLACNRIVVPRVPSYYADATDKRYPLGLQRAARVKRLATGSDLGSHLLSPLLFGHSPALPSLSLPSSSVFGLRDSLPADCFFSLGDLLIELAILESPRESGPAPPQRHSACLPPAVLAASCSLAFGVISSTDAGVVIRYNGIKDSTSVVLVCQN